MKIPRPQYRLGIDVGGTFTDLVIAEPTSGELRTLKVPTVHNDLARGVADGIATLLSREGISPHDVQAFVHGTTLATNTIIERTGAPVGLLVTRGTRDVLEIGRLRLGDPTNFYSSKPVPLVPRRRVREVSGRLLANGTELEPVDLDEIVSAASALLAEGAESVAICFLHSYANATHEQQAAAAIRARHRALFVTASSEVWAQQREYERTIVTVINATLGHRIQSYLRALTDRVARLGMDGSFFCTKSNGGVMSVDEAGLNPVQLLLSGPAAGVVAALYLGDLAGESQLITLDIGGTSADLAVVARRIPYSSEGRVGDYPVLLPTVDISAIGAGGGSIAWLDGSGALKVGPRSAGSDPGPASYGRGGKDATVTDAYLTTGIIAADRFLGGSMQLDSVAGAAALSKLGNTLRLSAVETAAAVIEVTTAAMHARILPFLAARGVAAGESTLYAYGGAGPTHAFLLARELGVAKVMVPPTPGALCALGCLVADLRVDFIQSVSLVCDEGSIPEVEATLQRLARQGQRWLVQQHVAVNEVLVIRSADMRYVGQSFEINVVLPEELTAEAMTDAFGREYESVYLHQNRNASAEVVNLRVQVVGVIAKLAKLRPTPPETVAMRPPTSRQVYCDGAWVDAQVFDRYSLAVGASFSGPAVVEQYDTTVFVPPKFAVRVDEHWNLVGWRIE